MSCVNMQELKRHPGQQPYTETAAARPQQSQRPCQGRARLAVGGARRRDDEQLRPAAAAVAAVAGAGGGMQEEAVEGQNGRAGVAARRGGAPGQGGNCGRQGEASWVRTLTVAAAHPVREAVGAIFTCDTCKVPAPLQPLGPV